jgi:hypothetical protein
VIKNKKHIRIDVFKNPWVDYVLRMIILPIAQTTSIDIDTPEIQIAKNCPIIKSF